MIIITRENGYADKMRDYSIILDGEVIGRIADGQTKTFDVKDGIHTLRLSIDWAESNEVSFEFSGNDIKFKCANSLKGWRVVLAIAYATFLSHKYLMLRRVD